MKTLREVLGGCETRPQRLKPESSPSNVGTAEAVPYLEVRLTYTGEAVPYREGRLTCAGEGVPDLEGRLTRKWVSS